METLTNIINQELKKYTRFTAKYFNNNNNVCYKVNNTTNPSTYDDEFIIEYLPKTDEYNVIVPINSVSYRKTFTETSETTINKIVDYLKMHMDYYCMKNI